MGYIGNEPTTGHFPVDNFTSSGGSTYTLAKAPASAGAIEVSVQGVLQPTTAYTVSGTTLTMAGVTSGVKIFVRHLGETLSLPTPADGSVTTTKLAVNAVDGTKIAMGSDARGDILYHGATDYARLAKGTSGQVLTMGANDPAWAAAAADNFPIGAGAYVTGGQAIPNNSATTLIFNTEAYDPNSNYNTSNGTYTVPSGQAGKYLTTGHISIPVVDPQLLGLGIKVNGTTKIFQGQYGGTDTGGQLVTIILDLSVSDAVTWYCHHKAGASKTTEASAYGTGMSIQRVA